MDDLNNLLIQVDIQSHEVQGPQDFHQFPELPPEIREKIWKFSFPDAYSIQVYLIMLKDSDPPLLVDKDKP